MGATWTLPRLVGATRASAARGRARWRDWIRRVRVPSRSRGCRPRGPSGSGVSKYPALTVAGFESIARPFDPVPHKYPRTGVRLGRPVQPPPVSRSACERLTSSTPRRSKKGTPLSNLCRRSVYVQTNLLLGPKQRSLVQLPAHAPESIWKHFLVGPPGIEPGTDGSKEAARTLEAVRGKPLLGVTHGVVRCPPR
jgi:hypothetical protein